MLFAIGLMSNIQSDQDIIDAFNRCPGKNPNVMANEIWSFLNEKKKRAGSEKDVPHTSTIKRILHEKGLDKKLKK